MVALAERMEARGHAVSMVVLGAQAGDDLPASVTVHHLGLTRNPLTLPRMLFFGVHVLRAFQPDIIHGNNFHGNLLARGLRIFIPRARVVSTIHNVYEGGRARSLALRLTDSLSAHSAAVCHAAADAAILRREVRRPKCSVIANGIDCEAFAPDGERRSSERSRAGLTSEFVWLAAGRLAPAKDHPHLLHAFAQVHAAAPEARLWIAGEGNRRYTALLHTLAGQLGLGASVRWLGLRRDIPALLDLCDGFVLASAWEGMPLALGEAMAMERALVATNIGGVRELAGECGVMVSANKPALLAAAMLRQMRLAPEIRSAQGRAARNRILLLFPIEASADRWEELYCRIAETSAALT